MILKDYSCPACAWSGELLLEKDEKALCPICHEPLLWEVTTGKMFKVIVPDYPGAHKRKAGYVHQYVNKSATKVQVGYGGGVTPK
jgi:hypothetical protein